MPTNEKSLHESVDFFGIDPYYVRDVAGSVMAIYEELAQVSVAELVEVPIYGASRLGVHRVGVGTSYELTDHLGNVRALVAKDNPTPSMFADYYPGGMQMPNRNSIDGTYRYAYQGQEKDPETGKEAFQLRLYDSRINRWLTTDPAGQYHSPYMAMGNNWMNGTDPDGAWHYENGHLVTDPGDTAASLSEFSGISIEDASSYISAEGFIFDHTSGDGYGFYGGQVSNDVSNPQLAFNSMAYFASPIYDVSTDHRVGTFGSEVAAFSTLVSNIYKDDLYTQLNGNKADFNKVNSKWARFNKKFASTGKTLARFGNVMTGVLLASDLLDDGALEASTILNTTLTVTAIVFPVTAVPILIYGGADLIFDISSKMNKSVHSVQLIPIRYYD